MSDQESKNEGMQIRLSPEEARKLAEQGKARRLGRHPQQEGGGGGVDMISVGWAFLAFLGFLGAVILYLNITGGNKLIQPMDTGLATIPSTEAVGEYQDELQQIENLWNSGQLNEAVSTINMIFTEVDDRSPQVGKALSLLKLKSFVVQEEYEVGNRFALTLMQRYRGDDLVIAEIYWYRGHIYYYQQEYQKAINAFAEVIALGGTHAIKAQEYKEDIREVVSDDQSWF
ncbi:MAG: tetratricopeptide repeat protein [Bacteroidota bacterium]